MPRTAMELDLTKFNVPVLVFKDLTAKTETFIAYDQVRAFSVADKLPEVKPEPKPKPEPTAVGSEAPSEDALDRRIRLGKLRKL